MTTVKSVTAGNYTHTLAISTASQDFSANTSTINYTYKITRNVAASSGAFATSPFSFRAIINGASDTEEHTFDFRTTTTYTMVQGSRTITHTADGTKTISASFDGPTQDVSSGFPEASGSGTYTLPAIPRASTASFDVGGVNVTAINAGSPIDINTNRASTSFTHDITITLGSTTEMIGQGIGASMPWTPPMTLLNEIPNAASGVVKVKVTTYGSDGDSIGSTTTNLTLNAPASVVPTIASVTATEATTSPAVATIVGGFVQGISKLNAAMTGTAGAYGSTIVSSGITVAGQSIAGTSGTTTPITVSGTIPVVATVTDSRGRVGTRTLNVTVLPYSPPVINTFTVQRATVGGTIDPNGTYLSINLVAAVQSLIVGTQKNDLKWAFKKQARGGTADWSTITPDTSGDAHATGVSTTVLPGTYPIANAYDIRMEVTDNLGTVTAVQGTVSTGGVLLNLSTTFDGIGVGKYWAQGSVDALGQMYQNNGRAVVDTVQQATAISSGVTTALGTIPADVTALKAPPYMFASSTGTGNVPTTAASPTWAATASSGITYDTGTKKFTMPKAGFIHISASINFDVSAAAPKNSSISVVLNGTTVKQFSQTITQNTNSGAGWSLAVSADIPVALGDTIEVYGRAQVGTAYSGLASQNYIDMHYWR